MSFDLLPNLAQVCREAIEAGLIETITLEDYDRDVKELSGPDLEDYIQEIWDNL